MVRPRPRLTTHPIPANSNIHHHPLNHPTPALRHHTTKPHPLTPPQDQAQSDSILDDLSCMLGCTRSSLNVVASEKGVVVGRLQVRA